VANEEEDDEEQQPAANGFTDENQQWLKPKKTKKVRSLSYDGISLRCSKRSTNSRVRIDLSLPSTSPGHSASSGLTFLSHEACIGISSVFF
jgi:hypothetical protein